MSSSACCNDPASLALPPAQPAKTVAECGGWVGYCGPGIQRVYFYLGDIQAPVTVWFRRKYEDDTLTAFQFGDYLESTPDAGFEGSFTFEYKPYSDLPGMDEIYFDMVNRHNDSQWEFRVDCPVEFSDKPVIAVPKETQIDCGRYHHQAGYAKKNTIILGDEPGNVDVTWSVQGYAEVTFFQGDDEIETIKSNRVGKFSFFYDPTKGEVYALSQGTGTVDYFFTCPFIPPEYIPEKFAFTCGEEIHQFEAPKVVDVILPEDQAGSVEINFSTESTVVLKFYQRETLLYTVQQFEGEASFSFDYDPLNGPLKIVSENYGLFSVGVKCPYVAPPEVPVEPEFYRIECGDVLAEFSSPSFIDVVMPSEVGKVTVTYVITGMTQLVFTQGGIEIGRGLPQDGLRVFEFEFDSANGNIHIEAQGTDPFSLAVGCPVPPPPPEYSLACGTASEFNSPSNITLTFGEVNGNFDLTVNSPVAIYNNDQLVASLPIGTGRYLYTVGDRWKLVSSEKGTIQVFATCPSIKELACGTEATYTAGDKVVVWSGDEINTKLGIGDTHPIVVADAGVQLAWYVESQLIKTTTGSTEFDLYLAEPASVTIDSSGTGSFTVLFPCPIPRPPELWCGEVLHSGEGTVGEKTTNLEGDGSVLITYELQADRSIRFFTNAGDIITAVGPAVGQIVYDYTEIEGPIKAAFTGTGLYRYAINCPTVPTADVPIPEPDAVLDDQPGDTPDEPVEVYCDDVYNTELPLISDLTKPVSSAGTTCEKNLISRAYAQNKTAGNVYGAQLVTMVRDLANNNIKSTGSVGNFEFFYEFPLLLEPDTYTFVLKAKDSDCTVGMFLDCYPVLDRGRNLTLREDVTLFDTQHFVQISWKYADSVADQTSRDGGIYAAIVHTATGNIVWRSGDDMPNMRHDAPLRCEDKPRWPISRTPMTEKVECPAGQTKDAVIGGQTFITATWERVTWSDGVVGDTEKQFDGVCAVPPYITSTVIKETSKQCPAGETKNGVWEGTATVTGTYEEYTWSDGSVTQSEVSWSGYCAVPEEPTNEIVSTQTKTEVTACPTGQTKQGIKGGSTFITGTYEEYTWSFGNVTRSETVYPSGEYCAVVPPDPPYITKTTQKSERQNCPTGQTVNGIPNGRTYILGTYQEYTWSNGTITRSETIWEEGASCQVVTTDPAKLDPVIGESITYSGIDTTCSVRGPVGGTVLKLGDASPFGSNINPVNAALYGPTDALDARRIVFSGDGAVKPTAKDFYVSVPLGLLMSLSGGDTGKDCVTYAIEVAASNVAVSAPMLVQPNLSVLYVSNGTCSVATITEMASVMSQPYVSLTESGKRKSYVYRIAYKGNIPYRVNSQPSKYEGRCPTYTIDYTKEYSAKSILFKVDTRNATSGHSGFSFVIRNPKTGAILYKSGQDGNIRVTA